MSGEDQRTDEPMTNYPIIHLADTTKQLHQNLSQMPNANTYVPARVHEHALLSMAADIQAMVTGDGHAFETKNLLARKPMFLHR